jgi:hypothetical protein
VDGYGVVNDDLTAHASHLDAVVDQLNQAVDAAQTVSMSTDAYGLLCQFLPPAINPVTTEGLDALRAAVEGVQVTAENVRSTVNRYTDMESEHVKSFDSYSV